VSGALLVAGCAPTHVALDVSAQASGRGYVSVSIDVPASTAAYVPDLSLGIPSADLRATGWWTAPLRRQRNGDVVLVAKHSFSALSQVPALVDQVAGSGPGSTRPFQVDLRRSVSALHSVYSVQAHVDLRCGLGCFADPALARSVGYGLGLPPGQLHRVMGPHPERDMVFTVELSLPGKAVSAPGEGYDNVTRSFGIALGGARSYRFHTEVVDVATLRNLLSAVGAGSLLVLLTAAALVARHRRAGRRRAGRRRARI
jgi:hypothetical protein